MKKNTIFTEMDKYLHYMLRIAMALIVAISIAGSVRAGAADLMIDTRNANNGFVTIHNTSSSRMKIGICYNKNNEIFLDCPNGKSNFALEQGSGTYIVTLYRCVSGTTYTEVAKNTVTATIKDQFAVYKVATAEVAFTANDAVSKKVDELCRNKKTADKVVAIWNFIRDRYQYDYAFAKKITSGEVKQYTPDPNTVLSANKGICYDFASLFAAMCRTEGIPCKIVKGYVGNTYHAWNQVYVDGEWREIDLTSAICKGAPTAAKIADCVIARKEK